VLWEIIATGRTVKKYNSTDKLSSLGSSSGGHKVSYTNVAFLSVPFSECKNQMEIREKVSVSLLLIFLILFFGLLMLITHFPS
jgi:hypothetical protein